MKKDAYYFSHDSNAKDDPKCMMLIEQLGLEGYGIFWVLVETLRDQPNYKYPLDLLPAIARRYNTSFEKVKTVVANYDLFIIDGDDFFFSKSLNERMKIVNYSRISGIKGSLKRYKYLTLEQMEKMSDSQILDYHELVQNKEVSPLGSPLDTALPSTPLARKEKKGNESKKKRNNNSMVFSDEIKNFTAQLVKYFPEHIIKRLNYKKKLNWVKTVDALIRLDKYSKEEILRAVKSGRNDDLWKNNFLALTKLRTKNAKQECAHIDIFLNLSSEKGGNSDKNIVPALKNKL
jgi:hypothetical protein